VVTVAQRVVIGYDGSDEARCAIDFAARVLPGECALIVHVWQGSGAGIAPAPSVVPPPVDRVRLEAASEEISSTVAREGARHARAAGFAASRAVRRAARTSDTAQMLHEVAAEYEAALIVVARTHASWLTHALRGNVAISTVREDRRPVLVVPG
jgi:nucleotide-binding universal stress UspA family protein